MINTIATIAGIYLATAAIYALAILLTFITYLLASKHITITRQRYAQLGRLLAYAPIWPYGIIQLLKGL